MCSLVSVIVEFTYLRLLNSCMKWKRYMNYVVVHELQILSAYDQIQPMAKERVGDGSSVLHLLHLMNRWILSVSVVTLYLTDTMRKHLLLITVGKH